MGSCSGLAPTSIKLMYAPSNHIWSWGGNLTIGSPRPAPDTTTHNHTHDPGGGGSVLRRRAEGSPSAFTAPTLQGRVGDDGGWDHRGTGPEVVSSPCPPDSTNLDLPPHYFSPTLTHWDALGSGEVLRWGLGNSQVFRPRHEKSGGRGGSQWDLKTPRLRFQTTSGRVNPPTEIPRSGPRQLNRGGHGSGSRRTGPMQLFPPQKKN